jgi:peptidoglycan-associated lipoprotein
VQLRNLVLLSLTPILFSAACSKRVPVAAAHTAPVPVAEAPAPAKPAPPIARAEPQPAAQTVAEPRRPTVMTAQDRATLNERLAHLEDALFDYDKSTIRKDALNALQDDVNVVRGILENYPSQKLVIEGHADERGSDEYNLALGDQRARAAEDFLAGAGVSKTQLTIISYGKSRPICTEDTEGCWQRNRRAHISAAQ